jgi:SPP1 gp7 family putative phage head morphogenesis protein
MLKSRGTPIAGGCGCGCGRISLHAEVRPFSTDPIEAITFLRNKINVPTATWTDLWQEEHSVGFTVAGATQKALVSDFHDAVNKAVADGTTLEEFRKDFDRIVAQYGWDYNGGRDWRSRIIFDTNMSTAYAAGRWQQIQQVKQQRPYLRYVHLEGQAHPRPEHAAWHNTILPVDDPWWQTHYPPNGWNCHCTVESLNERDLARYGLSVSAQAPQGRMVQHVIQTSGGLRTVLAPEGIDPGFAYRPGALPAALDAD